MPFILGPAGEAAAATINIFNDINQTPKSDIQSDTNSIIKNVTPFVRDAVIKELLPDGNLLHALQELFSISDFTVGCTDLADDLIAKDKESFHLDNGLWIQEGDFFICIQMEYDLGIEFRNFLFYFRESAPIGAFVQPAYRYDRSDDFGGSAGYSDDEIKELQETWRSEGFYASEITDPNEKNDAFPNQNTEPILINPKS